jgi:sulfite exporter TauE/SafE
LWAIFLTGLLTGGLTCLAVQGGLLAATIAQREEEKLQNKVKGANATPILAFLVAKLIAYTLLGFLLGMLGSVFRISLATQIIMQVAVAIFMVGTALNILDVHPIFRYFVIQPPKFLTRLVRKQSKSKSLFAPILLGAFTVFIPCGTTQAMMALAIGSGSPLLGAAVLFAFILGTSPVFFLLGYFMTKLGDVMHQRFMRFAAVALILLALFTLNNALVLWGSSISFDTLLQSKNTTQATMVPGVTKETITITSSGYTPNNFTIKAGAPITLHIVNTDGVGCVQAFTIPSLGIEQIIPVGQSATVTFTAPLQPGALPFMCSMGMYKGTMQVI